MPDAFSILSLLMDFQLYLFSEIHIKYGAPCSYQSPEHLPASAILHTKRDPFPEIHHIVIRLCNFQSSLHGFYKLLLIYLFLPYLFPSSQVIIHLLFEDVSF